MEAEKQLEDMNKNKRLQERKDKLGQLKRRLQKSQQKLKAKEKEDEIREDLEWWRILLPRFNGVSMMDLEEWDQPDQFAASDACLTSCGGFWEGKFFYLNQKLHINALELLTLLITVKLWGKDWKGKKMVINCDNASQLEF